MYAPQDAEATRTVFHQAVQTIASQDYSPEQIATWRQGGENPDTWAHMMDQAHTALVCEDDEGLYAFATLTPTAEVHMLMCHPRKARQGAASQLLRTLETTAQKAGMAMLTTQASLASRRVFEKAGFHVTENRTVAGMACFGMEKPLR